MLLYVYIHRHSYSYELFVWFDFVILFFSAGSCYTLLLCFFLRMVLDLELWIYCVILTFEFEECCFGCNCAMIYIQRIVKMFEYFMMRRQLVNVCTLRTQWLIEWSKLSSPCQSLTRHETWIKKNVYFKFWPLFYCFVVFK